MRCQEIMSKDLTTVQMNASVQEVARLMADKDIGFVPIVDQSGSAVGTVTDSGPADVDGLNAVSYAVTEYAYVLPDVTDGSTNDVDVVVPIAVPSRDTM